ncbi:GH25 family lysozyme [uncultured Limosilactobacillus sp.]|uniref:GH25 family lysozyme n=1 Tax=uncultured Limosilactobacillus sp. TaxID=2837629 RepID=UPI0025D571B6|nr:GH25 family lysozyme [uncultured Limosilactobacillus sp.]
MTAVINTVDISEFQSLSEDDWQAMKKAGIETVIIRATSSLRLDKLVKIHIANAKKYGFNWHLYHDWEGQSGEAEFAIQSAQALGLSNKQVLFFDMEGNHTGDWSAIFEDFRQKASSHFKVGLYISDSPYQSRFNDSQLRSEHVIRWIANYSKEPKNYDVWQKSGHGSGGFGNYTKDIDRDVDPSGILKVVADDPVKEYQPTAEDIMIRQIILQAGFDSETGIYGLGCSYDNGKTFKVYWTIYGQKYYQEDADRLWPFLKNKITNAMSIDWDSIQNKPKFVTSDELEARLNKLSVPTIKWADIEDKPVIPSTNGLAKESELADYAKKSEVLRPQISGWSTIGVSLLNGTTQDNNNPVKYRVITLGKLHRVEVTGWITTTILAGRFNLNVKLPQFGFEDIERMSFSGNSTLTSGGDVVALLAGKPGEINLFSGGKTLNNANFNLSCSWVYEEVKK